jgi:hypothetical protein
LGLVEWGIAYCVLPLVSDDEKVGQIVTADADFKRLGWMLSALHEHRLGDTHATRKTVEALLKTAGQLEAERNRLLHSSWGLQSTESGVFRFKTTAKGVLKEQIEPAETAPIRQLANDVRHLYHEFGRLGNAIRDATGSKQSRQEPL